MIKKYIKKHIPVEAVQWEGRPGNNTPDEHNFLFDKAQFGIEGEEVVLIVHTLEGDMKAHPGDYIVKGVDGEFYPVKKEIFEKTYVEAKEDDEFISVRKDRLEELIKSAYEMAAMEGDFCALVETRVCKWKNSDFSCSDCKYEYDDLRDDFEPPVKTVVKWLKGECDENN